MARGLMNALQLALGAAEGAASGYGAKQALQRQRQLEDIELQRQKERDVQAQAERLAGLLASGWETPASFTQQQTGARNALGSIVGSALQAASTGVPSAGPSKSDLTALQSGFATAQQPTRKVNIGGQDLVLRETDDERQERLAQTKALQDKTQLAEAQRLQNMLVGRVGKEGLDSAAGMELAQQNPSAFNALAGRAYQQEQVGFERQRLGYEGRRVAAAEAAAAATGAARQTAGQGGVVLPSITEAINNFKSITPDQLRKISSAGVAAASTGQMEGGLKDFGLNFGGSLLGVVGDQEKRYAQQAGAIADAVARASEVGVLTNFDINRFRSQILFAPGDSDKIKQEKLSRAVKWGEWLTANKQAIEQGKADRIRATPESQMLYQIAPRKAGESIGAYLARTGGR